jgi:hypothetical protein
MIPSPLSYQLVMGGLLGLCVMLPSVWPRQDPGSPPPPVPPVLPPLQRKRSNEPKPLGGLTQRPPGALCAHETHHPEPPPPRGPAPRAPRTRRPRVIATSRPCGPQAGCA